MLPDPLFVARLRLVVVVFVRLIVLMIAGVALVLFVGMLPALLGLGAIGRAGGMRPGTIFTVQALIMLLAWSPFPAAAITLFLAQRRVVAWLVPTPNRFRCPACNYDTRYLTEDRCPECGLELSR